MMVAQRRISPYAQAHSFGTDGSAALAGSPISSVRRVGVQGQAAPRRGLMLSRRALIAVLICSVMVFLYIAADLNNQTDAVLREVKRHQFDTGIAGQQLSDLETRLQVAADETRVQSYARNHLGMTVPTDGQIFYLPKKQVAQEQPIAEMAQDAKGEGLFRLLLSTFGL